MDTQALIAQWEARGVRGDKPVTAYRSRSSGSYQRARSFSLIGTLAVPVW